MTFKLDPRLNADTVLLAAWELSDVLLMDDARYPWIILVPRQAGMRELTDLDSKSQHALLGEINRAARALQQLLRPDKINIAALGNIVSQLHVHVVARFANDAAWPQPVWGHGARTPYGIAERRKLLDNFIRITADL